MGFGLPTIGIGLGALISDIPTAMMLILVPTIFTNIAQVLATGSIASVFKETWVFLFGAVILIPLGLWVVVIVPEFPFERLLGMLILVYSLLSLSGFNPVLQSNNSSVLGLTFGLLNSVLTGMTGSMTVPGVMYLRSLQLSKDDLLCAMGILFLISTLAMVCVSMVARSCDSGPVSVICDHVYPGRVRGVGRYAGSLDTN